MLTLLKIEFAEIFFEHVFAKESGNYVEVAILPAIVLWLSRDGHIPNMISKCIRSYINYLHEHYSKFIFHFILDLIKHLCLPYIWTKNKTFLLVSGGYRTRHRRGTPGAGLLSRTWF